MLPSANASSISFQPAKLLVVEDDPDYLRLLEKYLETEGHTIIGVASGEEALALLDGSDADFVIDGVLLDRKLGGMDGLSVLRTLKADERLRSIPVIMITGMTHPEDIAEGIAGGVYYYMTKPLSPLILRSLVRTAMIEQREQQLQLDRIKVLSAFHQMIDHCEVSFKSPDDIRLLAPMLAQLFPEPQRVLIGISEIMLNAVEHGNLELNYADKSRLLASGAWLSEIERRLQLPEYTLRTCRAVFRRTPRSLSLTITDCGRGFDWHPYLNISTDRAFDLHGRGISLSRMIAFDRIEYRGTGNEVVLSVAPRSPSANE